MTREYRTAAAFKQALEQRLRTAIDQTFGFRGTHDVPGSLPAPPGTWEEPYATIAKEDLLRWPTLDEAFEAARAFLDPVLVGLTNSRWDPDGWSWVTLPAGSDSESD